MLDPSVRAQMLDPEPATSARPGVAGRIKARPEDFVVDEIAAYPPDGRPERHLLVRVRKRSMSTPEMLKILARDLGVASHEIGCAGRKDREAVTTQWISVPWQCRAALDQVRITGVEFLEVHPHGQKLRTGHLHGNRFRIVVRDPGPDLEDARHRVRDKLIAIERGGGLENLYGEQRFGRDGSNIDDGMELLLAGRRLGPQARFLVSAVQSALFNLYVVVRKEQGWLRKVLPGDVLQRRESGGQFVAEDAAAEQPRLERGELVVSGPIFGAKMRAAASASALLEDEVLRRSGLTRELFAAAGGKRLPGARRPVQVGVSDFGVEVVPEVEGFGPGVELRFSLPAGSYATQLLRELQSGPDRGEH